MEKKKMRLLKKILIIISAIIILFIIYTIYRYMVITKIHKMTMANKEKTNLYYYSETEDTIMEFWRKDNIKKINLKQAKGDGDITFWLNENTNVGYIFYNSNKTYEIAKDSLIIEALPMSMISNESSIFNNLVMSIVTFIMPTKYNDTSCYYIRTGNISEKIEKDTGMLLYSCNPIDRKIRYSFDSVTDEDTKIPDITEYTINNK